MTIASTTGRSRRAKQAQEPKTVRVACYARISVADREASAFSSVEAQVEAIQAYITSQKAEGWTLVGEPYVDDGYSGGSTNRPALERLLESAQRREIDIVVVHRFDRFSRSQRDFLNMLHVLEEHEVAFASVSQQLDTSNPMGRCMLSVMTAFGQLEREVIAERTRDKTRAARRKGLWTGGRPMLGFDLVEKRLVVNPEEAERVRGIIELYLELGSLLAVMNELRLRGWRSKAWTGADGKQHGGGAFSKQSLATLLRHPVYVGRVRAGDEIVEGQHEAIVDEATWQAVQDQLEEHGKLQRGPRRERPTSSALLLGIVRCACGASMTTHSVKRGSKSYPSYVCMRYVKEGAAACPGSRVAVGDLESFVIGHLREVGRDQAVLETTLAADREERETRRPELAAQVQQLAREVGRAEGERRNLLDAIAKGGATEALQAGLEEANEVHAELSRRNAQAARELEGLDQGAIEPKELRQALLDLDGIWAELFPAERARVLGLLIETVVFDAAQGEVEITFRPGGPAALWKGRGGEA